MEKRIILTVMILGLLAGSFFMHNDVNAATKIKISSTNFPDKIFRNYVRKFDKNEDGYLSKQERHAVEEIIMQGKGYFNVKSYKDAPKLNLKGIEYFPKVKRIKLNYFTLENLKTSHMKKLSAVEFTRVKKKSFDFTKNSELYLLSFYGSNVSKVKLKKDNKIKNVDFLSCKKIKEIDLTQFPLLESLEVSKVSIKKMDFSQCKYLRELYWKKGNLKNIIFGSKNSKLEYLDLTENKLTSLDLNGCTALAYLECSSNPMKKLDVSTCKKLQGLYCGNMKLKQLDLSKNTELTALSCYLNQINHLDLRKNKELNYLSCYECELEQLNVVGLAKLERMDCRNNKLTELELKELPNLERLKCLGNPITYLDTSDLVNLNYLVCYNMELEGLELSNNLNLETLYCQGNKLKELNLKNNTKLRHLWCDRDVVENLEVFELLKIESASCQDMLAVDFVAVEQNGNVSENEKQNVKSELLQLIQSYEESLIA